MRKQKETQKRKTKPKLRLLFDNKLILIETNEPNKHASVWRVLRRCIDAREQSQRFSYLIAVFQRACLHFPRIENTRGKKETLAS